MSDYCALDAVVQARARVQFIVTKIRQEIGPDAPTPPLLAYLEAVERDLAEHVDHFGAATATHYSSGLPIWSMVNPSPEREFAWIWHPRRDHSRNQPRTIAEDDDLGGGERGAIVIVTPGVLDVVRKPSGEGA